VTGNRSQFLACLARTWSSSAFTATMRSKGLSGTTMSGCTSADLVALPGSKQCQRSARTMRFLELLKASLGAHPWQTG